MSRLRDNPHRLQLATYPHVVEITTSFSDLDPARHLNNVAIARFFQEGRVSMESEIATLELDGASPGGRRVIGKVEIEYLAEGAYPGLVIVGTGLLRLGV